MILPIILNIDFNQEEKRFFSFKVFKNQKIWVFSGKYYAKASKL